MRRGTSPWQSRRAVAMAGAFSGCQRSQLLSWHAALTCSWPRSRELHKNNTDSDGGSPWTMRPSWRYPRLIKQVVVAFDIDAELLFPCCGIKMLLQRAAVIPIHQVFPP